MAELESVGQKHASLLVQLESDKNESDFALSELYRSRIDYRNKEEESLSEIENLKAEISGFSPKLMEIEKAISTKSEELDELKNEYSQARKPIDGVNDQIKPLEDKFNVIEEEKVKLLELLTSAKNEADKVEADYNLLANNRNQARDNFEEDRERLMKGIKKPHHIYYSDTKEVKVANRAPSGKGIFINNGYEEGFREEMEFVTSNPTATSDLSFRLKVTLVQKNFSFLEFLGSEQRKDPTFAREGQLLEITRSGKYFIEQSLDQNISTNEQ